MLSSPPRLSIMRCCSDKCLLPITMEMLTFLGSWFCTRNLALTTNWLWIAQQCILEQMLCAWEPHPEYVEKEFLQAVARDERKQVFRIRHFRWSTRSNGLPPSEANDSPSRAMGTKWRFHCGMVLCWTGLSDRIPRSNILTAGSMAGSYFQCLRTEAIDVRWEMTVDVESFLSISAIK